jgi:tellurite resistance protein TerC
MMYVFGGLLLYTVIKMIFLDGETFDPSTNKLVRLLRRVMKVTTNYSGDRFFVRENGAWHATPMLLVVLVIESSDLIFAVDSIPAIFAITTDPFIVFSSNIFAILGLRALYFVLAGMAKHFDYLKPGIIFILFFVAVKMLIADFVKVPEWLSLAVIGVTLALSIFASVFRKHLPSRAQAVIALDLLIKPNGARRNGKPQAGHRPVKHTRKPKPLKTEKKALEKTEPANVPDSRPR